MKPFFLSTLLFFVGIVFLTSCEKVEYFKSEKTISKELQGSWSLVPIPQTLPGEIWTFSNNIVYRSQEVNGVMTPIDTGAYTINTYTTKVVIEINEFKRTLDELNGNWQVVQLTRDNLIFATDHYKTTGILQREFTRVK